MPAYYNPSPALRAELEARGVEPLGTIWHRAAVYEQPGNNFAPAECVDRAVRFVLRDPDFRFTFLGDAHTGTLTCQVPGCESPHMLVTQPWNQVQIDGIEAAHWDARHRETFGP